MLCPILTSRNSPRVGFTSRAAPRSNWPLQGHGTTALTEKGYPRNGVDTVRRLIWLKHREHALDFERSGGKRCNLGFQRKRSRARSDL